MAFKLKITTTSQTSGGNRPPVEWDKLNEAVITAAGTADKARSIPGVISGIYDLGEQVLEDAEQVFKGTAAEEAAEIEKFPKTYFKDGIDRETGKQARLKCWPQNPVQQVAIAVDFPQVIVDKGVFFGKTNPQPLRMLLNGEFQLSDGVKIVGRPYNIRETNHAKAGEKAQWAFAKNNGLHKLAAACELLDTNGLFTKDRIGELLGKVAQFQFRVWMKPSKKDATKKYFTEDISLVGLVPEGVSIPTIDEALLHGVSVWDDNDEEAVKQLRACVKNSIKKAQNYEGSNIQVVLEKLAQNAPQERTEQPKADNTAPKLEAGTNIEAEYESDIPF